MTSLFHQPVCPFSRKVRLMLGEKKFSVEFVEERPGSVGSIFDAQPVR